MKSAVLLLAFNRPDSTALVFEAIRAARPPRLYVSVDGPRVGRSEDTIRCAKVRSIASDVDWPCELHTHFLEENLGCRAAVGRGLDWFFENEPEGVILEDDVLPEPGFFDFCDELLEKYRNDDAVAAISGSNFIASDYKPQASYFFSRYTHVWGWATWRRAWLAHDQAMSAWPAWRDAGGLEDIFASGFARRYWREQFDAVHERRLGSWAFPWLFTCWSRRVLAAMPAENQTTNLGFGRDATHTNRTPRFVRRSPARTLSMPLRHPPAIARDTIADSLIDREVFDLTATGSIRYRIRMLVKRLRGRG